MRSLRWKACMSLLAMAVTASLSSATTYVFDSSDSNWYEAGELTRVSGTLRMITNAGNDGVTVGWNEAINPSGGQFFAGDYAGVLWTAPVGEVVTNVQVSGFYRADGGLSQTGYGLYAGSGSAATEYVKGQGGSPVWVGYSWSADVAIAESAAVDTVEVRAWWHQGGSPATVGTIGGGYFANIGSITITTVPEPATMALLVMGGMMGLRRVRK